MRISKIVPLVGTRYGHGKVFTMRLLREREWIRALVVIFNHNVKHEMQHIVDNGVANPVIAHMPLEEKLIFARDMMHYKYNIGVNRSDDIQELKQKLYIGVMLTKHQRDVIKEARIKAN